MGSSPGQNAGHGWQLLGRRLLKYYTGLNRIDSVSKANAAVTRTPDML
jgi:hypothetical protein